MDKGSFDSIVINPQDEEYLKLRTETRDLVLNCFGLPVYISEFVLKSHIITVKDGKVVGWIENISNKEDK